MNSDVRFHVVLPLVPPGEDPDTNPVRPRMSPVDHPGFKTVVKAKDGGGDTIVP
jgi:hypothetical protein